MTPRILMSTSQVRTFLESKDMLRTVKTCFRIGLRIGVRLGVRG